MVPNRSRPLLLVLHADHPDRSLDAAIGAWFVERVRAHERFDVEVLNAGAWDASKAGRAPAWRAPLPRFILKLQNCQLGKRGQAPSDIASP